MHKQGFAVNREKHFAELRLSHCNVVKFLGCDEDDLNVFIVMELSGMNLVQFAREWGRFANNEVRTMGKQLTVGLAFLHSKDIVHR